jgi:hypothetical protein
MMKETLWTRAPRLRTQSNPRSLANLLKGQWEPGRSGNPSGRPKKKPITDRYHRIVETELPDDICHALDLPWDATFGDAIALAQERQAIKGETAAAKEIREAIEGRSIEQVDQGREFSVVMIDRSHRPDWAAMRRAQPKIEVPGLPGHGKSRPDNVNRFIVGLTTGRALAGIKANVRLEINNSAPRGILAV